MTEVAKNSGGKPPRIKSVDFLRGLVIIIMALDHVRDYVTNVRFDPVDIDQTNAVLFFTRWITHFCAPVFIFLAGTSAGFQRQAGKTGKDLSLFLLTRGIWLVFLELTIVKMGWVFNLQQFIGFHFLQVIWAIGICMIILAGLVWLPLRVIAAIGVIMIAGHNLLTPIDAAVLEGLAHGGPIPTASSFSDAIWIVLHLQAGIPVGPTMAFIAYPIIPWIGVMALGYAFAEFYSRAEKDRQDLLLKVGLSLTAGFFILRGVNIYGDGSPWAVQDSLAKTVMSFFNTTKYPPSLLFLLMTLGPGIIILSLSEKWKGKAYDAVVTFGRVPLFFYIIHIYAAHMVAVILGPAQGFGVQNFFSFFFFFPPEYGVGLAGVYLVWIGVVVLLYPLCHWFAGVKKRSKKWWLSYF